MGWTAAEAGGADTSTGTAACRRQTRRGGRTMRCGRVTRGGGFAVKSPEVGLGGGVMHAAYKESAVGSRR